MARTITPWRSRLFGIAAPWDDAEIAIHKGPMSNPSPVNPPRFRRVALALGQVLGSAFAYSLLNALSSAFQISGGVSVLFPGTAVSVVACMYAGWYGAIGVFLGTLITPWETTTNVPILLLSGVINAAEGLIPFLVFRYSRSLRRDLSDVRSLLAFIVFGVTLNTGASALLGNLFLVPREGALELSPILVWWVADFTAAMLLATPFLAFAPRKLARFLGHREPERPRSIANALQIIAITLVFGWAASAILRNYLINHIETLRLDEQQKLASASSIVNELHSNFLFASGLELKPSQADTHESLVNASTVNDRLLHQLEPYAAASSAPVRSRYTELAQLTRDWFADVTSPNPRRSALDIHMLGRKVLALKTEIELQNLSAWELFARNRRTIMAISLFTDVAVFLILLLASVQLIYEISRPLRRLHSAVEEVRFGAPFESEALASRYTEMESLRTTLSQTLDMLRKREAELSRETERAMAASRHKTEFLAKMSHELRTPLNSIVGFSELLLQRDIVIDTEKRQQFIENVSRSARHLLLLINDLLDLARLESGKINIDVQPVDVRYVIESSAAIASPLLREKQQALLLDIPSDALIVNADPLRLQQILLNLLSNATKFSGAGTTVTVQARLSEDHCAIEVRDQGIGIPPEAHERIFLEFEQVHARGEHSRGAGLGLALARRFVEAMNGSIAVRSTPHYGATFEVVLPLNQRKGDSQLEH
jgi:signal transduction histidine kinase